MENNLKDTISANRLCLCYSHTAYTQSPRKEYEIQHFYPTTDPNSYTKTQEKSAISDKTGNYHKKFVCLIHLCIYTSA